MTVQVDDILRAAARLTFENDEDDIVNVYHFGVSGGAETEAQTLLNIGIFLDDMYQTVQGRMATDVDFQEISVKNVTQNIVLGDTPWPTLTVGALAAEQLPPQVTALVIANTLSPSRQGRKYLGGFTETDNDSGVVGSALIANLANFAIDYVATRVINTITYRSVIMEAPDGPLQPIHPLETGKVITAFRTQRRRTVGRGS